MTIVSETFNIIASRFIRGGELLNWWLILFIISLVIELITLSLVSIWFSAGALMAIFLEYLGVTLMYQVIGFIITSLMTFFIFKPMLMNFIKSPKVRTNADRLIGKTGKMISDTNETSRGQVKVEGQIWGATPKDNKYLKAGTIVNIVGIEGVRLIVTKK